MKEFVKQCNSFEQAASGVFRIGAHKQTFYDL